MDSCCDYFKNTPLHACAAKAKMKIVLYLIEERKVSPFVRSRYILAKGLLTSPNELPDLAKKTFFSTVRYNLTKGVWLWIKYTTNSLKGNFVIFYMLVKYVPGDIKYIFTKFYQHISTNKEVNRTFVILISIFFIGSWHFCTIMHCGIEI